MKHFKKFFSYLVALTMVLSLATFTGVKVYATEGTTGTEDPTYTLTIKNTSAGHILNMYQILTGDVSSDKKLSNAKWGDGVSSITFSETETKKITADDVGKAVDEDTMRKFPNLTDLEKNIKVNEKNVYRTFTVSNDSQPVKFEGVKGGYYVVTDTAPKPTSTTNDDATAKKHTVTYSIVQVVGTTEVAEKAGTIQSEKKVEDVNDSTGAITNELASCSLLGETKLGDSADYDIGDSINYTIEAKLPENYASYVKFPLTFVDTMSKGLTYNNDAKLHFGTSDTTGVSVNDLKTEQFITETSANVKYSDGEASETTADNTATKYSWVIKDLKALATAKGKTLNTGDVVYITYSATLNEQAVIDYAGNPNKMHIEYNNNPEIDTTKTNDHTPDDTNVVFTYDVVFNKTDGNKPLTGADFKLEKWIKDTSTEGGHWDELADSKTKTKGQAVKYHGQEIKSDNGTRFTFHGLDDGQYRVTETKTPDGFNTIDPVVFTIVASHVTYSSNPVLTSTNLSASAKDNKLTFTAAENDGSLSATVVNKSGSILPSTGGMGTTLLYVAGGILVACAAAYVVMSRKHSTNK